MTHAGQVKLLVPIQAIHTGDSAEDHAFSPLPHDPSSTASHHAESSDLATTACKAAESTRDRSTKLSPTDKAHSSNGMDVVIILTSITQELSPEATS